MKLLPKHNETRDSFYCEQSYLICTIININNNKLLTIINNKAQHSVLKDCFKLFITSLSYFKYKLNIESYKIIFIIVKCVS